MHYYDTRGYVLWSAHNSLTNSRVYTNTRDTSQPRPTKSSLHTLRVMTETEIFLHKHLEDRKQS
jgi:hypothetical protein